MDLALAEPEGSDMSSTQEMYTAVDELAERIDLLFENEPSLLPHVVLKGAAAELWFRIGRPNVEPEYRGFVPYDRVIASDGASTLIDVFVAMGYPSRSPADVLGYRHFDDSYLDGLPMRLLLEFANYEVSFAVELAVATGSIPKDAASRMLAWYAYAYAYARVGGASLQQPLPDLLQDPGWYVNPTVGYHYRYWDGDDWTKTCIDRSRSADLKIIDRLRGRVWTESDEDMLDLFTSTPDPAVSPEERERVWLSAMRVGK